jgi:hypothetical protein
VELYAASMLLQMLTSPLFFSLHHQATIAYKKRLCFNRFSIAFVLTMSLKKNLSIVSNMLILTL